MSGGIVGVRHFKMLRVEPREVVLKHGAPKKVFAVSETALLMGRYVAAMWFYLEQEEECPRFKK
jgi:hypothetical protein